MTDRRRRQRAPNPYGGPLTAATMVALGAAAVALLVFAPGASWVRVARSWTDDLLSPAQTVVAAPFAALRDIGGQAVDHMRVYDENRRLREENARLRQWYQLALAMRDKMDRYEEILSLNPDPTAEVVVARVVAETDGPFVKTRVLNAGSLDGVTEDQAVLSEHGLIGRVLSAGDRSARVLLLKDLNSAVPVQIERNDVRAILTGDNSERPRLLHMRSGHGLISGDRVITSGDGGFMPHGLPVGEAFLDGQGQWRVRLYSDDGPIDFVRVVKFNFPRAVEPPPAAELTPSVDAAAPVQDGSPAATAPAEVAPAQPPPADDAETIEPTAAPSAPTAVPQAIVAEAAPDAAPEAAPIVVPAAVSGGAPGPAATPASGSATEAGSLAASATGPAE